MCYAKLPFLNPLIIILIVLLTHKLIMFSASGEIVEERRGSVAQRYLS